MPNYDVNSVMQFGRLVEFGQGLKAELNKMSLVSASAIKSVGMSVDGLTINFYTSTNKTGDVAFSVDFPKELVLDQLKSDFEASFTWSDETYPGSTNPNLDGKPVLIFAIKGTDKTGTTTAYKFVNLEALIDTYKIKPGDSAKILAINSETNEIEIKISSEPNNAIRVKDDGLHVDVSGKVDKVQNATAGDVPILTAEGGIASSGHGFATTANVNELLDEMFPSSSGD